MSFLKDSYLTINIVFAAIIVAIVCYSYIFSAVENRYPIPSGVPEFNKESSISPGLSRSFSEIVRFRFKGAATFNPYGIRIFSFFFIQLLMRFAVSALLIKGTVNNRKTLALADALVSTLFFVFAFWPFIISLTS